MVTTSGPVVLSPSDIAHATAPIGARDRLKQPPPLTGGQSEALEHLSAVRADLKDAPRKAAAAKVAYLQNKMRAIQLAAGTASATGDLKFVRSALHDMRALVKDLARALKDAGIVSGPAAKGALGPDSAAAPAAEPAPAEPNQASETAQELVKELKKIVSKLRVALVAAQIRGEDPQAVKEAEKNLRDGEKELQSLGSSLSLKVLSGHALDVRA